ncbi:hypothetical protein [Prosthecomicrobium pneumaticum]|uniref:Uncharacterized protein n=1 Tax=Prosthecomicrobium pneumaticum TaxID=81895 RepID=A0A7W9L372_9HYPH|nr:hypothetical protein [Prosthecomicrobium pneumaticum]MBB5754220.1 hypothetical protein [Prosthecomicrobium pneumaticum]
MRTLAAFLDVDPAGFGGKFPRANAAPPCGPFDEEAAAFMRPYFDGLTERVDGMIGRPLDWSL